MDVGRLGGFDPELQGVRLVLRHDIDRRAVARLVKVIHLCLRENLGH